MPAMSDLSREGDAATNAARRRIDEPDLIEALAWPFQIAAAMRGTAPSTNPNVRTSHAGNGWRVAMIVMVALTFAWGLVGALLLLASLPFRPGT
jgi:hypothetical protein